MKRLIKLKDKISSAERAMKAELSRRWPEGSHVDVVLLHHQIKPTPGKVVGHDGDGHVRVRIDTAKERSRRSVRCVYFENIISPW